MHLRKLTPLLKARHIQKETDQNLSGQPPPPFLKNTKENLRHPGSSLPFRKRCSPIKEKDGQNMRMRRSEARSGKIWGLAESNIISRMQKMEEKPQIYNRYNSITPLSKFNTSCDARVQETIKQKQNTDIFLKMCRWETNTGRVKFSSGLTCCKWTTVGSGG